MITRMDSPVTVVSGESGEQLRPAPPFEDFFEAEHLRLYRALFIVTNNRHEAEELMQEAFLKVWERWDRVRTMGDPRGYLYRTAMNTFRSRYRRAGRAVRRTGSTGAAQDASAS